MTGHVFESISTDELWNLHEQVASALAERIAVEKAKLEERLRKIETASSAISLRRARRPYPKVFPKYQNPLNAAQTWSGRGKQPRWVKAQLKAGKTMEHFLIVRSSAQKRRGPDGAATGV